MLDVLLVLFFLVAVVQPIVVRKGVGKMYPTGGHCRGGHALSMALAQFAGNESPALVSAVIEKAEPRAAAGKIVRRRWKYCLRPRRTRK
jgi:hypothetical protein